LVAEQTVDVVIVGAGLSGIGAACHLRKMCPDKSFAILESRNKIGGTWDLFRYPGIRSDSDMYTLGYNFKPWRDAKSIADGPSILRYIREAAREHKIEEHIHYGHQVKRAAWSSEEALWTITADTSEGGKTAVIRCNFIQICAGYYSYENPYTPEFEGRAQFRGEIVHPQHWPEDLDFNGKRVVVIGSGATAVTLIPKIADAAKHVVMLQRSPTYMASLPDTDWIANFLRRFLSAERSYAIVRWKNIRFQQFVYGRTRTAPEKVKKKLLKLVRNELGPDYDVERHFTPSYNPWDQRLCLVPNGDFFQAIRTGKASVVTDEIVSFTNTGILLKSGEELPADIIVTATGLNLRVLGDIQFEVDGQTVDISRTYSYKAMMYSDMPNVISTFGYINASWTLRADLTAEYACRLVNHMDTIGMRQCTPRLRDEDQEMPGLPWIKNFSSGYIQRRTHLMPKQGNRAPWVNTQNYDLDKKMIRDGEVADDVLEFRSPAISK